MAAMLYFFYSFLIILTTAPPASSLSSSISPSGGSDNVTEFIRASCRATQYPVLCFTSLARYSYAIQLNPVHLAHVATNLTLARIAVASARVSSLRRSAAAANAPAGRVSGALRDCASTLHDAADLTERSRDEVGRLAYEVGPEVGWRVANAQTWMSAALTNEGTCEDGFEGVVGPSLVKAEVCARIRAVKRFTSNALALINSLVAANP